MHYDAVIIGAGMSGLAAGIRLAYFGKRVCILEKHYAFGGLNSYYRLGGRNFDVGLHAVTNFVPPHRRNAPLNKLFRQLRIDREEFDLHPQGFSEIRFPGKRLRFTNDIADLTTEIAREFPQDADNFPALCREIEGFDDAAPDRPYPSARGILGKSLRDPMLIEMLLCPIMFYGSAQERDMDWTSFVTLFRSLYLEGFARPPDGVRTIIRTLVKKFRACGGALRMNCGVERLYVQGGRVTDVVLESGETVDTDIVLSSAGYIETMRLCDGMAPPPSPGTTGQVRGAGSSISSSVAAEEDMGRMTFVESIGVLDTTPAALGHDATIVFYNDAETFTYEQPREPADLRSGILCCPNNYAGHEGLPEGVARLTWMANHDQWALLPDDKYAAAKEAYRDSFIEQASRFMPAFRDHLVFTDMFTPRTIRQYTGHVNGAVYGCPRKRRDGRTALSNLFIIGTDQGYLGIVGAMLSGVLMANSHVLDK